MSQLFNHIIDRSIDQTSGKLFIQAVNHDDQVIIKTIDLPKDKLYFKNIRSHFQISYGYYDFINAYRKTRPCVAKLSVYWSC